MGVVHLALDSQLGRKVALKRMAKGADLELSKRMVREAQAMAQLDHPNVVRIFDADRADGQFFIAMEYVDGVNLASWLDKPRSLAEVVEVFRQAGSGLAEAHRASIVHRDFKPQNVLIAKTGEAKVTDFGLAKAISKDAPEFLQKRLTAMGNVPGTPRYMAPEQRLRGATDARSDMFSFALALAESLGLKSSLQRARAGTRGGSEVRDELGQLGVPAPLANIIDRALRADPAERFRSMDQLLDALDQPGILRSPDQARPKQTPNVKAAPPRQLDQAPVLGPLPQATPSRLPWIVGASVALIAVAIAIIVIAAGDLKSKRPASASESTETPLPGALAEAATRTDNSLSPLPTLEDFDISGPDTPPIASSLDASVSSLPQGREMTTALNTSYEQRYGVTRQTDSTCVRLTCPPDASMQKTATSRFCARDGKYLGPHLRTLADGTVQRLRHYQAGKPTGRSYSFSSKLGHLARIDHYASGRRHGPQYSCDASGNPKSVSHFENGVREGAHIRWDADGSVRWVWEYKRGERIAVSNRGDVMWTPESLPANQSPETPQQLVARLGWDAPRSVCRPARCLP